jgi:hypothetical protein
MDYQTKCEPPSGTIEPAQDIWVTRLRLSGVMMMSI